MLGVPQEALPEPGAHTRDLSHATWLQVLFPTWYLVVIVPGFLAGRAQPWMGGKWQAGDRVGISGEGPLWGRWLLPQDRAPGSSLGFLCAHDIPEGAGALVIQGP